MKSREEAWSYDRRSPKYMDTITNWLNTTGFSGWQETDIAEQSRKAVTLVPANPEIKPLTIEHSRTRNSHYTGWGGATNGESIFLYVRDIQPNGSNRIVWMMKLNADGIPTGTDVEALPPRLDVEVMRLWLLQNPSSVNSANPVLTAAETVDALIDFYSTEPHAIQP